MEAGVCRQGEVAGHQLGSLEGGGLPFPISNASLAEAVHRPPPPPPPPKRSGYQRVRLHLRLAHLQSVSHPHHHRRHSAEVWGSFQWQDRGQPTVPGSRPTVVGGKPTSIGAGIRGSGSTAVPPAATNPDPGPRHLKAPGLSLPDPFRAILPLPLFKAVLNTESGPAAFVSGVQRGAWAEGVWHGGPR